MSPPAQWPWHTVKSAVVSSANLRAGERRMEAETYLLSGLGIRVAIESRTGLWVKIGDMARVWMPGRLKGIQVGPEVGTPFLAATQVFDVRPTPRKWLALARTADAKSRFVKPGTIFVTCSGTVGRTTVAYSPHENTLISHDLLRVEAIDPNDRGWLYAYLHAPQVRAMMVGAKYGHVIKHLETFHLEELPIVKVDEDSAAGFARRMDQILALRNSAFRMAEEANSLFAAAIGPVGTSANEAGYVVRASEMASGRRRLEAAYHSPKAKAIAQRFSRSDRLGDLAEGVWWMPRFKRYYGDQGIPYLSADELFTVNPPESKRILVNSKDNYQAYFVKNGWLVMACSGQVYGMNGATALMTGRHENVFFSHDLIRIVPNKVKIRPGYLLVALTHRTHGRPLLLRAAYGTSIPHLDPGDVAEFPVVRLAAEKETAIADLAESSARSHADTDTSERELADDAGKIIDRFIARR